jgi:integrase
LFDPIRRAWTSLIFREGIHPNIVEDRTGHASIQVTVDTYSHVAPGLQEAAAESFDKLVSPKYNGVCENEGVEKTR